MKTIEKNEGQKIAYKQTGTVVSFADGELSLNCASYQRDWDVHLDICSNTDGNLVIGTATGLNYVAELDIPAREYIYPEEPTAELVENGDGGEDEGGTSGMSGERPAPTIVPLDMKKVTLSLWAID